MDIENLDPSEADIILDTDIEVGEPIFGDDLSVDDLVVGEKVAYPNSEYMIHVPGQHDTDKWLSAVKELYTKEKDGLDRIAALSQTTANWKPNEKLDFKNWLRFYEEGNHLKYKIAQTVSYLGEDPGYYFSFKPDAPVPEPVVTGNDFNSIKESVTNELTEKEKKDIINKQRKKFISRLDSIEKLLRSDDGHLFAGKELESLMETIYGLKKKVNTINKRSTSTRLYEDMIVREANVLVKKGYNDAAELLYALAQDPAAAAAEINASPTPNPMTGSDTAGGSGSAGGLPASIPAQPNAPEAPKNDTSPTAPAVAPDPSAPPSSADTPPTPIPPVPAPAAPSPAPPAAPPKDPKSPGISSFLKGLKGIDSQSTDDLEVFDDNFVMDDELIVEAQAVPGLEAIPTEVPTITPAANVTNPASSIAPAKPLEVAEEVISISDSSSPNLRNFDNQVNQLFSQVSIEDIIAKLEDLSKIFKVREVPRQLGIVDMMLDSLGLASYFPDLSEATNKALESNNYISTRIDAILSRLHGATKTRDIDLYGKSLTPSSADAESIKKSLESLDNKEKIRKQIRKDQEINEALTKAQENPEIEIDEDLLPTPPAPAVPAVPAPAPVATPTIAAPPVV